MNVKQIFYVIMCVFAISSVAHSQDTNSVAYPKVDIHAGLSMTKGTYIGSIIQPSKDFSFEISYGGSMSLFLGPSGELQIIGIGANYHLRYFILNLTYVNINSSGKKSGHIASMNINLFYIEDPGFHLIGGIGGLYIIGCKDSENNQQFGLNFNLAIGFTIL